MFVRWDFIIVSVLRWSLKVGWSSAEAFFFFFANIKITVPGIKKVLLSLKGFHVITICRMSLSVWKNELKCHFFMCSFRNKFFNHRTDAVALFYCLMCKAAGDKPKGFAVWSGSDSAWLTFHIIIVKEKKVKFKTLNPFLLPVFC